MNTKFFYTSAALTLFLFSMAGCVTTAPEKEEMSSLNSCADTLTTLVDEARKTMHSADAVCYGLQLEATPMWGPDYDGTVHVRAFDSEGNTVLDEMKTPGK